MPAEKVPRPRARAGPRKGQGWGRPGAATGQRRTRVQAQSQSHVSMQGGGDFPADCLSAGDGRRSSASPALPAAQHPRAASSGCRLVAPCCACWPVVVRGNCGRLHLQSPICLGDRALTLDLWPPRREAVFPACPAARCGHVTCSALCDF